MGWGGGRGWTLDNKRDEETLVVSDRFIILIVITVLDLLIQMYTSNICSSL